MKFYNQRRFVEIDGNLYQRIELDPDVPPTVAAPEPHQEISGAPIKIDLGDIKTKKPKAEKPAKQSGKRAQRTCYLCGKTGHDRRSCGKK